MKILIFILSMMLSTQVLAEGDWGLEYDYDYPYEALKNPIENETLTKKPIYIPKYRFSILHEVVGSAGVRFNLQRDNYFYGLNKDRTTEYNSNDLDTGIFYTWEDNLVEVGRTSSDSPIWDSGRLEVKKNKQGYVRVGKNRFLKDKLDLLIKVSINNNDGGSLELKLIDKSTKSRPEFKLRFDRTLQSSSFTKETSEALNVILTFGF